MATNSAGRLGDVEGSQQHQEDTQDNRSQHTGDSSNSQPQQIEGHNNGSHPVSNVSDPKISLKCRAPTGPIAVKSGDRYRNSAGRSVRHHYVLKQRNQCVRSQLLEEVQTSRIGEDAEIAQLGVFLGIGWHQEVTLQNSGFPYPPKFQDVILKAQSQKPRNAENKPSVRIDATRPNEALQGGAEPPTQYVAEGSPVVDVRIERGWSFNYRWFGISRKWITEYQTRSQPVYVVVGIFQRGHTQPKERVVFANRPEQLFRKLQWATFRLRGVSSTFFSLRHVRELRLYNCDSETGSHKRVELDSNGAADLRLLLETYKCWHVSRHISQAWAIWIHEVLNDSSLDVVRGGYSIELVLGWSSTRITIVILLPVLLSLGIGIWLNASNWTDQTTIQTAWSTASYIVTAGGFTAALLGSLGPSVTSPSLAVYFIGALGLTKCLEQ